MGGVLIQLGFGGHCQRRRQAEAHNCGPARNPAHG